jgi:pimeloyl-ACP methyl ester carboxylesterase
MKRQPTKQPCSAIVRVVNVFALFFLQLAYCRSSVVAQDGPIATGKSRTQLIVREMPFEVFCYKPTNYQGRRMIVVMHGLNRNADEYRDNAMQMGDHSEALIVAPKFDKERFPSIKYNRGGILTEDKQAVPEKDWTYHIIADVVRHVRQREGDQELPFWIIGHSAGGQFVARMSAFVDAGAQRVIASNPGSHLFPNRSMPFGYGFGDLPDSLSNDRRIRAYLAARLTIYLGTKDDHPDENFDDSPEAMQQGPGRYQRGLACFEAAQKLAAENTWEFGWKLVRAEGVGHDHEAMFNHPACQTALFGSDVKAIEASR